MLASRGDSGPFRFSLKHAIRLCVVVLALPSTIHLTARQLKGDEDTSVHRTHWLSYDSSATAFLALQAATCVTQGLLRSVKKLAPFTLVGVSSTTVTLQFVIQSPSEAYLSAIY